MQTPPRAGHGDCSYMQGPAKLPTQGQPMVRMLLVAVIVLTAITEAMADTGIYECTAKSQLEVGSDGLPRDSWQPVPKLILFDVQSGLLLRNYEDGEAERDNLVDTTRSGPHRKNREPPAPAAASSQ